MKQIAYCKGKIKSIENLPPPKKKKLSVSLRGSDGISDTGRKKHGKKQVSWNGGNIVCPLKDMLNLPKCGGKEQYRRVNSVI